MKSKSKRKKKDNKKIIIMDNSFSKWIVNNIIEELCALDNIYDIFFIRVKNQKKSYHKYHSSINLNENFFEYILQISLNIYHIINIGCDVYFYANF